MKLVMGSIWNEASAMVRVNAQLLAAIAGVFFVLPAFAMALLLPAPQPQPGMAAEAMWPIIRDYYAGAAPWYLLMVIIQAVGQLAAFALLARSGRITVGGALREAVGGLLPWLLVQLIVGIGMMIAAALVMGIAQAAGVAIAVLIGLVAAVAAIFVSLRLALVLPVIAAERVRNPIDVMRRSWDLTRGNVGAILLYMILITAAFVVASIVIGIVSGIIAAVASGSRGMEVAGAAISALLGAGFTVYVVASIAAMHRQLTGGSPDGHAETFA